MFVASRCGMSGRPSILAAVVLGLLWGQAGIARADASADGRLAVALLPGSAGEGVAPDQLAAAEEQLGAALNRTGRFAVTRVLLDAAQHDRLTACAGNAACIAGIGASSGVELIAITDVARQGGGTQVGFKLIGVPSGAVVASATQMQRADESLTPVSDRIASQIAAAMPGVPARRSPLKIAGWVAAATGAAVGLVGIVMGLSVRSGTSDLQTKPHRGDEALQRLDEVGKEATRANVFMVAGGVVAAGGVALTVAF